MVLGVERLLEIAGIQAYDLGSYTDRDRSTIYRNMKAVPPPLWLLEAFGAWYEKNKPLKPEYIDIAFRSALHDLWPKSPVDPGSNRGNKKNKSHGQGGFFTGEENPLPGSFRPHGASRSAPWGGLHQ